MDSDAEQPIVVGGISGVYGVRGWLKVHSYTQPRQNILTYASWLLRDRDGVTTLRKLEQGKLHGKTVVAKLIGCDDRDQALLLRHHEIAIYPSQLQPLQVDEYYWNQLLNLTVVTVDGAVLGKVATFMETGANDVLVVESDNKQQQLIPYIDQVVVSVDLATATITVDWESEDDAF